MPRPLGPRLLPLLLLTSGAAGQGGARGLPTAQTPPIVRLDSRQWNLPLDSKVDTRVARLTIVDQDTNHSDINVTFGRVLSRIGPFLDGSKYFKFFEVQQQSSKRGEKKFDIEVARPLLGAFEDGDQLNLYIQAHDGQFHSKVEVYVRIEPCRKCCSSNCTTAPTSPLPPLPSTTTTPPPVIVTSVPWLNQSSSSASATGGAEDKDKPEDTDMMGSTVTVYIVAIIAPFIVLGGLLSFSFRYRKTLRKKGISCCRRTDKADPTGVKREIDNVLSNETEFTDLGPSRKTSMASTFSSGSQQVYSDPPDALNKGDKDWDPWEFPRHHLKIYGILGEGCFGQVWKCEALNIDGVKGTSTVAVKTLKESASDKDKKDLLQELEVMKMLKTHPNVVRLIGCCTAGSEKDPIFVIMEYVAKGKLQEFLRKSRAEHYYGNLYGSSQKLTSRDLTQFAHHVARGMEYLSSKKVIHRDLAARNVLVTDLNICKVADFGFSRDVMVNNIYERKSEGRLPIRWMAPESLYDNLYTTKTDVWSFGVLLWEIVTLGSTPYPGMSGSEVMKKVKEGFRLEKPEHCDREIYNMMFYCWDKDPAERPSFTQLVKDLEALLTKETNYIDLNQFPDHAYYNEVSLSGERV